MIPVIVAWTAVASPLFWRHIISTHVSNFQDVFRVFIVILWSCYCLNEIARPGGLAGRFRSHGDRN